MSFYFSNPYLTFYTPVFLAFLLARIPRVGQIFRSVNTFIHEVSHALMALVFSGQVSHIKLNADSSGEAATTAKYWIAKVLISLAGYTGSAVSAFAIFFLVAHKQYVLLFVVLLILSVISLAFWIRNTYGVLWIIGFALMCAALLYFKELWVFKFAGIFIGGILLIENVISSATLVYLSIKKPKQSSDALNLQKNTYIPAFIWAVLFLAFSLYMAYITITKYFLF